MALFFTWLAAAASAEPLDATLALNVDALTGQHQVGHGQADRLSFAPLPLLEATLRFKSESLHVEGLPPLTVGYFNQRDGGAATRLSIVNATYRHALPGGWFAGIGTTVYNQDTTYPAGAYQYFQRGSFFTLITGSLREYSRVAGLRLEAGQQIHLKRATLEYTAAFNPAIHGVDTLRVPTPSVVQTFADAETATQIDLMARIAQHVSKHGEILYGVRYINFTSHYTDAPGQLADRNVGFAPSLGYRIKL